MFSTTAISATVSSVIFPSKKNYFAVIRGVRCSQNGASLGGHQNGSASLKATKGPKIMELPLERIRRPLLRTRSNDPEKVKDLMASISEIGLLEPIDVLEVEGVYYGFSGCHRYEAHQRLGLPTIRCKVRKGTKDTLRTLEIPKDAEAMNRIFVNRGVSWLEDLYQAPSEVRLLRSTELLPADVQVYW